ncbi:MAG: hypothetical protein A3D92_14295 [Bacteroidetes bacterium RIFCSPHIGHO2_02_FULL_44_7]|nr:MAG: hypothetical protein A3D92_14295 [Bacteroidetes bacterium RIFCSPHIGHO2_02_FULL_44_7]
MVTLFFGNRSYALLFLPVIIGSFYFCNHLTNYHNLADGMNLGFWGTFEVSLSWLTDFAALTLILINAILLNTLFNRNEFMEKNNFLASMLYVVFMSFFPVFYHLDGLALAGTLLILSLIQLFRLNQNEDGRRAVFNAALLFGTACTLSPILLLGIPILFWVVWVIRPFVLRESLLLLAGLATPLLYTLVYTYLFQIRMERSNFSSSSAEFVLLDMLVLGGGLLLIGLASVGGVMNKFRGSSIRLKKLFRMLGLFMWMFLAAGALEFLVFGKLAASSLLLVPLIFFLTYAFGERKPKGFPTFIFYLLFLFAVGKFFIPFDQMAF